MPHEGGYVIKPIVNVFIDLGEEKEKKGKDNQLSLRLKRMHDEKMAKLEEIRAKTPGSSHGGGA